MALPILNLDDIRVASPCSMRWEDMTGGDRVRFCAACHKSVFNLSGMKRDDAVDLLRATDGNVCARFYRRKDGTVLTADCPVGVRLLARKAKRMAFGAIASSLGAVAAVLAFLASTPMRRAVDVEGARRAVVLTTEKLEEKSSALIVPERPYQQVAGGLKMPVAEPQAPAPKVRPKTTSKRHSKPPVQPRVEDGFVMGDVALDVDVK